MRTRLVLAIGFIILCSLSGIVEGAETQYGTASWYSRESCLREGTSGIMANGKELKDEELVCASWDYKFGTCLKITNLANGKSVIAVVSDRGPAKRLYRQGRIVDLSKGCFERIGSLKQGIIQVKVEVVK